MVRCRQSQSRRGIRLAAGVAIAWVLSHWTTPTFAQVIPDSTLGGESSVVTPDVIIQGLPTDQIDGGAIRGANLFHSFSEFNVGEGQRVYFANPTGIDNILSRVTGMDISDILGTLGVKGGANLFLINPNGIVFGKNAQLDVQGAFVASTAAEWVFENGTEFSATNPQAPPLLTINLTPGLQYGSNYQGAIASSATLAVAGDLILAGRNLDLENQVQAGGNLTLLATDTLTVRDSVASPFIASAMGQLLVQGNQAVDVFALNHPDSGLFSGGDMVLRSGNTVSADAHFWSGGNFRIEQLDSSLGNLSSPYDPIIASANDVEFGNYTGASLHILAGGRVRITGDIEIDSADNATTSISPDAPAPYNDPALRTITLSDNTTTISIDGSARPTLDIRAGIDWTLLPGGIPGNTVLPITTNPTPTFGTGATNANIEITGNIRITEPDGFVLLTNQYSSNGLSGDIEVGMINTSSTVDNGGSVFLDSRSALAITGNVDSSSFTAAGNGGNITLFAEDAFSISNNVLVTNQINGSGIGGDINVKARSVSLTDGARIWAVNAGDGQGGNITITATDFVEVIGISASGRDSSLASLPTSTGSGGDIAIETGRLIVQDGAGILTVTNGAGQGGNLTVNASESVELSGAPTNVLYSGLFAGTVDTGNGGDITIETKRLILQDGGEVAASSNLQTDGGGSAGNITIFASESVEVLGRSVDSGLPSGLFTFTFGSGEGGNLAINTGKFIVRDRASVAASTNGNGNAGDLEIVASESMEVINAEVRARTTVGSGNAGNLEITTNQLIVGEGGLVSASTFGPGEAGTLTVNADDFVQVIGTSADGETSSRLFLDSTGSGNAGELEINTGTLIVEEGGRVSATTSDQGQAGNLTVNADSVQVIGTSANGEKYSRLLFDTSGSGDAGILDINTNRLVVRDGARVSAVTTSTGEAGKLNVNASESVEVIGTASDGITSSRLLFDSSASGTGGNAGELTIDTSRLIVQDGGLVSATTANTGEAGKLTVNASESVEVVGTSPNGQTPSRLVFDSSGSGNAGELKIDTERLVLQGGGEISATTFDSGQGGIIEVNASESVDVNGSGSGLFFESRSLANARGITLNTGRLTVENGGQLTVSGSGSGTSGDLEITADSIFLTNQGRLRATTTASEGGNIRLDVTDSIIMRFNSEIAAEAFGTANGGNITINAGGIIWAILSENSDVVANAFAGQGGTISATALLIEGFRQFEDRRTPESDFTASSELGIDGTVEVNTETRPQLEPLPQLQPVDPIEARCQVGQRRGSSEFIISGRGGLPPNPINNGGYNQGWVDFRDPIRSRDNRVNSGGNNPQTERKSTQIIEAQGWIIKENGEVELVAEVPNPTLYSSWQTPICPVPNDAIVP